MSDTLAVLMLMAILLLAYMLAGVATEFSRANRHLSNLADRLNDIRLLIEKMPRR